MYHLLLLLLRHFPRLMLRQPPPDRPRLLRSQIQWQVLLTLIEEPKLRTLVRVDYCEDFGDGFAEVVAMPGRGRLVGYGGIACFGRGRGTFL